MSEVVTIETGVSENAQMSAFQNATLQGSDQIAFSIAAFLKVPVSVYAQGQEAVADYIRQHLQTAASAAEGLSFTVQIGAAASAAAPDTDPDED